MRDGKKLVHEGIKVEFVRYLSSLPSFILVPSLLSLLIRKLTLRLCMVPFLRSELSVRLPLSLEGGVARSRWEEGEQVNEGD